MTTRTQVESLAIRIFERAAARLIAQGEQISDEQFALVVVGSCDAARAFVEDGEFSNTRPSVRGDLGPR
jgi:hypothetical protein